MATFRLCRAAALVTAGVIILSGCSWLSETPRNVAVTSDITPPPPQTRVMQTADSTWLEPDKNAKPVPNASEIAELNQANKRIGELETQIADMRNDMDMMMPALTKLAGAQTTNAQALNDIQPAAGAIGGAGEVSKIHRNYMQAESAFSENPEIAMDEPMAMVPMSPSSSATSQVAPPPPPVTARQLPPAVQAPVAAKVTQTAYTPPTLDVTSIKGVRFGTHDGGKSRMVIDVSSAASFTSEIDNNEKILMVEIPGTVWNAGPVTRMIPDNPLIRSMAASPDGQGGTRVVFQLFAPARIQWSQAIPPSGGQGNRIVLDVVPAS